jgi:hypothetical protein
MEFLYDPYENSTIDFIPRVPICFDSGIANWEADCY